MSFQNLTLEQYANKPNACFTVAYRNIAKYKAAAVSAWTLTNGKDSATFYVQSDAKNPAIYIHHGFNHVMTKTGNTEIARNYAKHLIDNGYQWSWEIEKEEKEVKEIDSGCDIVWATDLVAQRVNV